MIATPTGPRRAALLLHSMQEADRAWLLAQLTPQEREPLGAMLAELRSLGIPTEPDLLKLAADPLTEGTAVPVKPNISFAAVLEEGDSPMEDLRRADPQRIADTLRHEPPALIASLLKLSDWPWREVMLANLPATKRRQVEESLAGRGPCAEKLGERLLILLLARLRETIPQQAAPLPAEAGINRFHRDMSLSARLVDACRRLHPAMRPGGARLARSVHREEGL